jgi:NMD protein affecting ribosome stability and mRNA decay
MTSKHEQRIRCHVCGRWIPESDDEGGGLCHRCMWHGPDITHNKPKDDDGNH